MDLLRAVLGDSRAALPRLLVRHLPRRDVREALPRAGRPARPRRRGRSRRSRGSTSAPPRRIGFESALRAYMADCLEGDECPFRGSVDEAMADLATLLASVDRDPLPRSDGRMLGADTLMTAIVAALYSRGELAVPDDRPHGCARRATPRSRSCSPTSTTTARTASTSTTRPRRSARTTAWTIPATPPPRRRRPPTRLLAAEAPTIAPYWVGPDPCEVWPYPPTGVRERDHRRGRRADRRRRHDERPGDAVRMGGVARRPALVRRADHPRRRGPHRLQQGQRLRRRRRRGVSARGHRAARTGCAASRAPMPASRPVREHSRDPVRSMIVHRASEARHLSSVGRAIHS